MSGTTVDIEALDQAAFALSAYIGEVSQSVQKMRDAARDCSDNMGNDVYSQKAIMNLGDCANELSKAMTEAEDLRKKILAKKQQIEDVARSF